ncbi:hypothetical protein NDU88_006768 [Pleurodeles waltl]|uniref:Uncharacterized protein n=1 Tax=Pleurodeles waltl TaxID=8319 RepID=A0AAV7MIA5_PLEWA|nr:hypothetical protein NDU88_006768 [Pleurodeles waltl]
MQDACRGCRRETHACGELTGVLAAGEVGRSPGIRYKAKERSAATDLTAREGVAHKTSTDGLDIDWRVYNGGVGDGARPGVSAMADVQDMEREQHYEDEEEEKLEEGEIPHWKDKVMDPVRRSSGQGKIKVFCSTISI